MRKITSFLLLSLASVSAFAASAGAPPAAVPEPEVLSLLAIGAFAFMMSRRKAK